MPILAILVSAVLVLSYVRTDTHIQYTDRETDRQTDRITEADQRYSDATTVGVSNK